MQLDRGNQTSRYGVLSLAILGRPGQSAFGGLGCQGGASSSPATETGFCPHLRRANPLPRPCELGPLQRAKVSKNPLRPSIRKPLLVSRDVWKVPMFSRIWESNANVLTLDDPDGCDRLTGAGHSRALLCRIYKSLTPDLHEEHITVGFLTRHVLVCYKSTSPSEKQTGGSSISKLPGYVKGGIFMKPKRWRTRSVVLLAGLFFFYANPIFCPGISNKTDQHLNGLRSRRKPGCRNPRACKQG